MSHINEILELLDYINQQKRPVSVVTTFQGVSSSLDVQVDRIHLKRGEIVVSSKPGRPISLLPATTIQIHSDLFPHPIQSRVISVDVIQRSAVLGKLNYLPRENENRKETRVQPGCEIFAHVTIGGKNARSGMINDISVEGLSIIFLSSNDDLSQYYAPKTSVRVEYSLPSKKQAEPLDLSIPATVTYINELSSEGKFQVGFQTYPKGDQRDLIRRFIFDRQTELFSEMEMDEKIEPGSTIVF
jgi:hypothetical protein